MTMKGFKFYISYTDGTKPMSVKQKRLTLKCIHAAKVLLKNDIVNSSRPFDSIDERDDIEEANKLGFYAVRELGKIHSFDAEKFLKQNFCNGEDGGAVTDYSDVNFPDRSKGQDYGPLPCDPKDWEQVFSALDRLLKKHATAIAR